VVQVTETGRRRALRLVGGGHDEEADSRRLAYPPHGVRVHRLRMSSAAAAPHDPHLVALKVAQLITGGRILTDHAGNESWSTKDWSPAPNTRQFELLSPGGAVSRKVKLCSTVPPRAGAPARAPRTPLTAHGGFERGPPARCLAMVVARKLPSELNVGLPASWRGVRLKARAAREGRLLVQQGPDIAPLLAARGRAFDTSAEGCGEARPWSRDTSHYQLSVVIPTRNEAGSIRPLLDALCPTLAGLSAEVVFVDDSNDETPSVVEVAAATSPIPVRLRHREPGERRDGLGGAVKLGFESAQGRFVAVMDCDLQHPPAVLREMLAMAERQQADLIVASRFAGSRGVGEFGALRQAISRSFSTLAKLSFPKRLRQVSDPMSGFFLVRRERLPTEELRPHGFKILLEVLVRAAQLQVAEVPYTFGERCAGESKASPREGLRYLRHLARLRLAGAPLRLAKFGAVGLSGLLVNTLLLAALTNEAGLFYLVSALVATELSIVWNFWLSDTWVFQSTAIRSRRFRRLASFAAINNVALALGGPLLWLLVTFVRLQYLVANVLSIGLLMVARFLLSDKLIWGSGRTRNFRAAARQQVTAARQVSAPSK
jgi:putative flippase GtrA